jgi:hypothetical protein
MSDDARRAPRRPGGPDLDQAIDATLRELAGVEGPVDMRRRVLARLEEPPPRGVPLGWLAAAGASAVVTLVALALLGRPPAPVPARVPAPPVARASTPPRPVAPPAAPLAPPAVARAEPAPPAPAPRRLPAAGQAVPVEPSAEVAMTVEPIELKPLSVAPMDEEKRIAVSAIEIQRMKIEPLAEPQP